MFTRGSFFPRKDVSLELFLKLLFCNDLHYVMKKLPQLVLTTIQVLLFTKFWVNETKKYIFIPKLFPKKLRNGPWLRTNEKNVAENNPAKTTKHSLNTTLPFPSQQKHQMQERSIHKRCIRWHCKSFSKKDTVWQTGALVQYSYSKLVTN